MNNKKIAIYGASGFGREVAWLVESCQDGRVVARFVNDDEMKRGAVLSDFLNLSFKQVAE